MEVDHPIFNWLLYLLYLFCPCLVFLFEIMKVPFEPGVSFEPPITVNIF